MLSENRILRYLIDHGYVDNGSFVSGNVFIKNVSSRNLNYIISNIDGNSYILKQGVGEDKISISNEARIYKIIGSNISNELLFIPKFYKYDKQFNLIILEMIDPSQSLNEFYKSKRKLSPTVASELGKILHRLHSIRDESLKKFDVQYSEKSDFFLTYPNVELFHTMSPANIELVKIIQQYPLFCKLLNEASRVWKPMCLVHCDVKWDNFLIQKLSKNRISLKLIDWELAGYGDPSWDIGSIFTEYLKFWVFSIPFTGQKTIDRDLGLALKPIEEIKSVVRTFWNSYIREMKMDSGIAQLLLRSIKLAALRMVISIYELGQFSLNISGNSIWLLQLAFNTLQKPYEAIKTILGISI